MYVRHDPRTSDAVSWIAARTRCEMFHSSELAKAIQADRIREIEQVIRERRLLQATDEPWISPDLRGASKPSAVERAPFGRSGSAREPA
jgi:hypothetical protein